MKSGLVLIFLLTGLLVNAQIEKLKKIPKDCICDNLIDKQKQITKCDTIYNSTSGGFVYTKDTIDDEVYFKRSAVYFINSKNELIFSKDIVSDYELFQFYRVSKDTTVEEEYEWLLSPFTNQDTLVMTRRIISHFIRDSLTDDHIQIQSAYSLNYCFESNTEGYRLLDYQIARDLVRNVIDEDTTSFNQNLFRLYSLARTLHKGAIVEFYELGIFLRDESPKFFMFWENYRKRLRNYI